MEVLSFITQENDFADRFGAFLAGYKNLILQSQDNDTLYFVNPETGKNEIYFHFLPNNTDYEFSYNYTKEELEEIINYFGNENICLFDIQFRDETFLQQLLKDFNDYLNLNYKNRSDKVMISHSLNGIMKFK